MTEKLPTPKGREFLLMEGGPLYRIQRRLGLIQKEAPHIVLRALLAMLLTWGVLFVLSAIQHHAFGHEVAVPFLRDYSGYSRFVIAIPLLVFAEIILGPRFAESASYFVTSGIITSNDYDAFDDAVERGLRLRDSFVAELILVLIAFSITFFGTQQLAVQHSNWMSTAPGDRTLAGVWAFLFCGPLLNFLVLRWFWRLLLWAQFLWRMSKLDLQIFPPHPDEAGGLGFVGRTQQFFSVVLFAYSAGIAGVIADQAIYDKVPLQQFAPAIVAYVVIVVILVLIPVVVFFHKLHEMRILGLYQYGALATAYTSRFHHKWVRGENPDGEPLLGTADIQSLADLGNSFHIVAKMDHLPMDPRTPIQLALACLIPMSPLLLIVLPLKDILKLLVKAVM
ncbi:hypothetical protein [Edaphobacter aggregans]|uniref:hypothetical protein n=1 Tax=Edaphobacter aggregans TaxID=570835 RepID=UPI00068B7DB8|nr:hypothetical protein [Edaphobacter aggregans]